MITDENSVETVNSVLVPNRQYNISVRDEPWDEKYEILHMIYNAKSNSWIKSPVKLKRLFQLKLVNQERVTPTVVSVIQVVKEFNGIKVAYSSSLFTLSNNDDLNKVCQDWIKRDKRNTKISANFFPCPCTLKEAEYDTNYEYDVMCSTEEIHPFWAPENCMTKKGAYKCVINKSTMYVYIRNYIYTYIIHIRIYINVYVCTYVHIYSMYICITCTCQSLNFYTYIVGMGDSKNFISQ